MKRAENTYTSETKWLWVDRGRLFSET